MNDRIDTGRRIARLIGSVGLHAYPADFRRHFGREMLRTHLERYAALPPGATTRAVFLARSLVDLVANGIGERLSPTPAPEWPAMRSIPSDVLFAMRSLRRHVGFTTLVVGTLSLGIGAATAVFSLANATLLRPVPVPEAQSVVSIRELPVNTINPRGPVAYGDFAELARLTRTLSGLAAYCAIDLVFRGERAEQVTAIVTSPNYFTVLGVHAMRGDVFDDRRAVPGAEPSAVIAESYWRSAFGADAAIVGRRVNIAGKLFTIIGIMASDFRGTDLTTDADFWIPAPAMIGSNIPMFDAPDVLTAHGNGIFNLVGRLAKGTTSAPVSAEVPALLLRIRAPTVPRGGRLPEARVDVVPISVAAAGADRSALVQMMRILLVAVSLVLLLACASVANVLLARAADRAGELSVRAACGASRARLVRQLLLESVLLGLLGAVLGLAVAWLAMRLVARFALPGNVQVNHLALGLDRTMLGCSLVLAVATPLVFGVWPALAATRADISSLLKSHTRRASRRSSGGLLLATQVSISLVLLTGALLFLRSVRAALDTDLGFDARGLAAITLSPGNTTTTAPHATVIYREVLNGARQLPGVTAAAAASHVPLEHPRSIRMVPVEDADAPHPVNIAAASEGYFDLLGVRFIEGRDFGSADLLSTEKRAVINEAAAKLFWPGRSAIGRQLGIAYLKREFASRFQYTVIGVVRDIHYETVNERGVPFVYGFMDQEPFGTGVSIVTRSADPAATLRALHTVVARVDRSLPVLDPRRVSAQIDRVLMPQRFGATLLSAFAIAATVICMVGLYGSVIYIVSSRTSEIGIRIALGADGYHVLRLVLGGAGIAIATGGLAGVLVAALGSGALSRFLYGVSTLDPASYGLAVVALLAVATLVATGPAIRALRIDPAQAVRGNE